LVSLGVDQIDLFFPSLMFVAQVLTAPLVVLISNITPFINHSHADIAVAGNTKSGKDEEGSALWPQSLQTEGSWNLRPLLLRVVCRSSKQ
jgi:hypothetical protein